MGAHSLDELGYQGTHIEVCGPPLTVDMCDVMNSHCCRQLRPCSWSTSSTDHMRHSGSHIYLYRCLYPCAHLLSEKDQAIFGALEAMLEVNVLTVAVRYTAAKVCWQIQWGSTLHVRMHVLCIGQQL